jgi:hypothetical protein
MNASNRISRRYFLFAAGGAAAVSAVVAARKDGAPAQPAAETKAAAGSGYRVTEHVRNYYRTTTI